MKPLRARLDAARRRNGMPWEVLETITRRLWFRCYASYPAGWKSEGIGPRVGINVLDCGLSLAGFQVIIYGRS